MKKYISKKYHFILSNDGSLAFGDKTLEIPKKIIIFMMIFNVIKRKK